MNVKERCLRLDKNKKKKENKIDQSTNKTLVSWIILAN